MSQVSFNLVLRTDRRTEEAVRRVDAACDHINGSIDLGFRRGPLETHRPGVTAQLWVDPSAGHLALVEDTLISTVYASPFLRIGYGHQTICDALRRNLETVPIDELRDCAERGEPSRAAALARLGLGENESHNTRTLRALEAGLASEAVEERRAATLAMFLLKWLTFGPPLDRALALEPDADLRAQMIAARQALHGELLL